MLFLLIVFWRPSVREKVNSKNRGYIKIGITSFVNYRNIKVTWSLLGVIQRVGGFHSAVNIEFGNNSVETMHKRTVFKDFSRGRWA